MYWALGFTERNGHQEIELVSSNDERSEIGLAELTKVGVPTAPWGKRIEYEGDFSTWVLGQATNYLDSFGLAVPEEKVNNHAVFTIAAPKGVTIHVPALVLMRAFFRPVQRLLPIMFSPANIDQVSFVNYASTPPNVVIDDAACSKQIATTVYGANQGKSIQWLQTSMAARRAAQSVHHHARAGNLKLDLPKGKTRIIFHGVLRHGQLYATKANLVSVIVPEEDTITGHEEEFIFHAMADAARQPTASVKVIRVPLHDDRQSSVNDDEWMVIEPILIAEGRVSATQHSRRELLDVILLKLTSRKSWKTVPRGNFSVSDLTSTFRRWTASNRLEKVLAQLEVLRARRDLASGTTSASG